MTGANQSERRRRALCLWAEDMRNRGQHEDDTQHVPRDGGKTGNERRQDILKLGIDLGLGALANPKAGDIIKSAAKAAGLDATSIQASWRVASGFAHGRYWPNLRAAELQGIALMAGGVLAKVAVDDAELKKLADACRDLLKSAERRYTARCTSRWPS
jgi:hypothetical protein